MDEKLCFLCRGNEDILYKLCDCNDSIICVECYHNEDTSRMNKCGICRKNYEFQYLRNYSKFLYIMLSYITKYGLILGFELFPPIYFYLESKDEYSISKDSISNNILLCISLFSILFGNNIIYKLYNIYIIEDEYRFTESLKILILFKIVYNMFMFFIIQFTYINNKLLRYNYFIFGIMYILPLVFFSTLIYIRNFKKIKQEINGESLSRKIKIKAIIHNNLVDLQSSINYV